MKKMTTDTMQKIVAAAISDAVAFIESDIADDRIKAQRYYDGRVDIGAEKGRSKVVATKCRDTVRAIKPSLMRVFLQSPRPVEFTPTGPEDVALAEQATAYVSWRFRQSNGFKVLHNAFHDALVKKTGIVKAYHKEAEKQTIRTLDNVSDDEFALIVSEDNVEVIEHSETIEEIETEIGIQQVIRHDAKIVETEMDGSIEIMGVPPEDFFIDPDATCLEDAYVCGHRTEMRVGDLVAMGFDFDDVKDLGTDEDSEEEEVRTKTYSDTEESESDPSMKPVLVTEAYMRMDVEGTGVPRLYSFICGGPDYKVLRNEPVDETPFAIFEVDPEPHAFFGRSLVDLVITEQDTATSMLRGIIDNVYLTNNPRLAVDHTNVNADDLLNNEIGGVIRTKGAPGDKLMPVSIPFVAGTILPFMQYFDQTVEQKTGVTRASMGMDPDALQSTTAAGVNATIQAAAGQVEVIARNLAEGGMKQLFRLLLRLAHRHPKPDEMMRINGQFVPIDPRSWQVDMDMTANVGLGTGQDDRKLMALKETSQAQIAAWTQGGGPMNGLVDLTNMRNTQADILEYSGLHNADRYWQPMNPQRQQMLMQQVSQSKAQQGQAPNPLAEAEMIKAKAKVQTDRERLQLDSQKAQFEFMAKQREAAAQDDLARDKMDMEMILKAADILGKYGVQVDQQRILQMQAAPREFGQ